MVLGKVLAEAAMRENKFVTWLPAYGAEVRGGTAHCMLIISDTEIGSPYVEKADSLIIMNSPSLHKFKNRIAPKGLVFLNSSLVAKYANREARLLQFPFSEIAIRLGDIKVANMVALGCYLANREIISIRSALRAIREIAPADKRHLVEINKKALLEGKRLK